MDKIILHDKLKEKWIFFVNEKAELCYIKDNQEQILQSGVCPFFDLITDENGNFHLVTQDSKGSLIYLVYNFENWKKYVILNSKTAENSMKNFKIFVCRREIHCFYLLCFSGKCMLVHHIFSPDEPSVTPKVIDSCKNFSCAMDVNGTIHIFYLSDEDKFSYKVFTEGNYHDDKLPTDDIIKDIYPICDAEGNLHILYIAKMTSFYTLVYFSKERKIISFGENPPSDLCLTKKDKGIVVQWRERSGYYQCSCADGSLNFKKPTVISESKFKKASPVKLRLAYNPSCICTDKYIALSNGNNFDIPYITANKERVNIQTNHKNKKSDYNDIDGKFDEKIKKLQSKLKDTENEILKLNSIISTLSDKISCMEKSNIAPVLQLTGNVEKNEENYQAFENMDIENAEFNDTKIF